MSRSRFIALLLVLGTLAVYLPVRHYRFTLFDDNDYITENAVVKNGLTWAGVRWAFTTWHASNWHPLTWLSHMLDCQLFGLNAGRHHIVNVLLHAANAVLLFVLLRRWLNALWPAAFVAALFAWHPLHVESVAWVAERKDVLSTFFALLTLLAYTKAVKSDGWRVTRIISFSSPVTRHPSLFYWLALIFFALGLMAKPMLVTLPFVMLLLDYWPLRRFSNLKSQISDSPAGQPPTFNLQLAVEKWPFFALAAASCIITLLAQHRAVTPLANVPLSYRFENAPVAVARYLLKMVWPEKLCVFYPFEKIPPLAAAAAFAVLVLITASVWTGRKRAPYCLTGWLWFLGMLVPVIGLLQVGSAAMADRYTYFPSVGVFLAMALGAGALARRFHLSKIMVAIPAVLALSACLMLTHRQLNYWRNDIALFSHAADVTANNDTAHLNLGVALEKAGDKAAAMDEYRQALRINPDRAEPHNNLANLLDDAGQHAEALAEYQTALRINPRYVPALNNLGVWYTELGQFDGALKYYAEAARLAPDNWQVPYLKGKTLLKAGRDAEALACFGQALQLDPNNSRSLAYVAQVLASDENPQIRDGRAALALAQKACLLTGNSQTAMLDALAMAYAELGDFNAAQQVVQHALVVAQERNLKEDYGILQQRLQLYQSHQPFRQSFTNPPAELQPKN